MDCRTYEDLASAHADGRLSPGEEQEASHHVATCTRCAALRTQQEETSHLVRRHAPRWTVSDDLRARLTAALDGAEPSDQTKPESIVGSSKSRRAVTRMRLVIAGAVAAALALVIGNLFRSTPPDLLATLASDVRAAEAGELELAVRASDVDSLRRYYTGTGRIDFEETVEDFSTLGLRPVGAGTGQIDGVPTTLTVYQGPSGKVVCRRFRTGSLRLPAGGEQIGEATVYTIDEVTVRVQRVGSVICVLASAMPRDAFVRTTIEPGHDH